MIKCSFSRQHHGSWCVIVGIEFDRVSVPCALGIKTSQPTLSICVGFLRWSFYFTIYKPAGV